MRSLHRTPVAVSDCYAPVGVGHPTIRTSLSGFVKVSLSPAVPWAVHGHGLRLTARHDRGSGRGDRGARVEVHTWHGISRSHNGTAFDFIPHAACGTRVHKRALGRNVDFDRDPVGLRGMLRGPRPASRASA